MANLHISGVGSNSNSGVDKDTAWRTIQYALSQVTEDSTIFVHKGVFLGDWGTLPDFHFSVIGLDENLFDAQGATNFMTTSGTYLRRVLRGLDFWDWSTGRFDASSNKQPIYTCINCVFGKKGAYYQVGDTYPWYGVTVTCKNCSFFGVPSLNFYGTDYITNCLAWGQSGAPDGILRYSALQVLGGSDQTGCFDADTFPPPFVSDNSATPDLRFNSGHAQYAKYMAGGELGMPIGALRGLGAAGANRVHGFAQWAYAHNNEIPLFDMDQPGDLGAWANNENFFDTDFDDVVIVAATNDKIDFTDDSGTVAATLAAGTYTSGAALATEVQTKMNAVATDTITVTWLPLSGRLQISSDGSVTFSLLWNTGVNTATTAGGDLGFVVASDDTGAFLYLADNHLLVGHATSTRAPVVWDDSVRGWKIDLEINPSGTDAEVVSPVLDQGESETAKYVFDQKDLDGTGAVALHYRTSTVFTMQAASPTWYAATAGTEITANNTGQFVQYKAALSI